MSGPICERRAYAKINLALAVGGPIPAPGEHAGYHPISSWMSCVDLYDDVRVERRESGESEHEVVWADGARRQSPIDWPIEKDLAVRAHRLLEAEMKRSLPAKIVVRKRTPVGGGLGGGSSDGAAALLAVREAFELSISTERLRELALRLGSDVGFFVDDADTPRAAVVSGLGERIERVEGVPQHVALFFPPFGCNTREVYRAFDAKQEWEGFEERSQRVTRLAAESARNQTIGTDDLFNDLEVAACHVEPQLRSILDRLSAELNSRVHVTGSGSTLFALAADEEQAKVMAARAWDAVPGVEGIPTKLV